MVMYGLLAHENKVSDALLTVYYMLLAQLYKHDYFAVFFPEDVCGPFHCEKNVKLH